MKFIYVCFPWGRPLLSDHISSNTKCYCSIFTDRHIQLPASSPSASSLTLWHRHRDSCQIWWLHFPAIKMEIWPHLSPVAALRRVGPALCLGNTVELALVVGTQASWHQGYECGRSKSTAPNKKGVWWGSDVLPLTLTPWHLRQSRELVPGSWVRIPSAALWRAGSAPSQSSKYSRAGPGYWWWGPAWEYDQGRANLVTHLP